MRKQRFLFIHIKENTKKKEKKKEKERRSKEVIVARFIIGHQRNFFHFVTNFSAKKTVGQFFFSPLPCLVIHQYSYQSFSTSLFLFSTFISSNCQQEFTKWCDNQHLLLINFNDKRIYFRKFLKQPSASTLHQFL